MNECMKCEEVVDFEYYIDITSDWVQVVLTCPECSAMFVGDIQIEHFEFDGVNE